MLYNRTDSPKFCFDLLFDSPFDEAEVQHMALPIICQHVLETALAKTPTMLPSKFETARILLRPVGPEDADAIFSTYAQDDDVVRYLIWRPHRNLSETQAYIRHCLA